jgi:hypothetical protein
MAADGQHINAPPCMDSFPHDSAAFLHILLGFRFAALKSQPPTVNPVTVSLEHWVPPEGLPESARTPRSPASTLEGERYRQAGEIQHHEVV